MGQQNAPAAVPTPIQPGNGGLLLGVALQLMKSSGNVANATAAATLAASALGLTTWITGFDATASGSTTAQAKSLTVSLGGTTLSYAFAFPAGVAVEATPISVRFNPPLPASAVDIPITVTLPAGGSGNAHAAVNAYGYQK